MCASRRIPRRSISRHDASLAAKHPAVTRRRPRSSKQIRSSSLDRLASRARAARAGHQHPTDLGLGAGGVLGSPPPAPSRPDLEVEVADDRAVVLDDQRGVEDLGRGVPRVVRRPVASAAGSATRRSPGRCGRARSPPRRRGSRAGSAAAAYGPARRRRPGAFTPSPAHSSASSAYSRPSHQPWSRCSASPSTGLQAHPEPLHQPPGALVDLERAGHDATQPQGAEAQLQQGPRGLQRRAPALVAGAMPQPISASTPDGPLGDLPLGVAVTDRHHQVADHDPLALDDEHARRGSRGLVAASAHDSRSVGMLTAHSPYRGQAAVGEGRLGVLRPSTRRISRRSVRTGQSTSSRVRGTGTSCRVAVVRVRRASP